MHCSEQITEWILTRSAGALSASATRLLDRHLAECEACRRMAEEQQHVWSRMSGWSVPPVSAGFDAGLMNAIASESVLPEAPKHAWWRQAIESLSWRPAMPLAALGTALLAVFLYRTPAPVSQPRFEAPQQKIDIEQAARTLDDLEMLKQLTPHSVSEERPL